MYRKNLNVLKGNGTVGRLGGMSLREQKRRLSSASDTRHTWKVGRPLRRRRMGATFLLLGIPLVLVACGSSSSARAGANSPIKVLPSVSIGVLPNGTQAPLFVAKALGYFRKQGVNVNLESFSNGPSAVQALEAGSVQGAAQAATVLVGAAARKLPVVGVYTYAMFPRHRSPEGLVVSASSGITDVTQLKNKSIAVSALGTDQDYVFLLSKYLPSGGLTAKEVQIVEVPFASQAAALEQNKIAAAIAFDPALSLMRTDPAKFRVIAQIQQFLPASSYPENVLVLNSGFVKSNPREVKAIVDATVEGTQYVIAHPAKSAAIVASATNGKVPLDLATIRDLTYTTSTVPPFNAYSALMGAMKSAGVLSQSPDPRQYLEK